MTTSDLRHALRRLSRAPGFSATVIVLLGLALGACACLFSVLHGLLYKPLPFPQQDRLVVFETKMMELPNIGLSVPYLVELARHAQTMSDISGYRESTPMLRDSSGRVSGSLHATSLQPGVFTLLGARVTAGRLFAGEDIAKGAAPTAVVGWPYAQQHFGSAEAAIGGVLDLDGTRRRIVGVLAPDFAFPSRTTEVWLPLAFTDEELAAQAAGSFGSVFAIAHLAPSASVATASDEARTLGLAMPEMKDVFGVASLQVSLKPLRTLWQGDRRPALELMLLAVAMVLLVTTANLCNLSLARSAARRHEAALQDALGAGPWRRLGPALAEALWLGAAGTALGLVLMPAGLAILAHFDLLPTDAPLAIGIDAPTLCLAIALGAVVTLVLGLCSLPLRQGNLHEALKQGSRRQTGNRGAQRLRFGLIVSQVAITATLLMGIGLLLRSSQRLLAEDAGFERDRLVYAAIDIDSIKEAAAKRGAIHAIVERARALPGVQSVGLGSAAPFGDNLNISDFIPPGQDGIEPRPAAYQVLADAGYFAALGAPMRRGRAFSEDEARTEAPVAIVDETFAQRYFDGRDPIGQHFSVGTADNSTRSLTVVGVVATMKRKALDEAADRVVIYHPSNAPPNPVLLLRSSVEPGTLVKPLKAMLDETAPQGVQALVATMNARITDTLRDRDRLNTLLALLGGVATFLTAVGLYAVVAYSVRQRTGEFGVRLALGADAARVQRQVLGHALRLVGAGAALGFPLAYALAHALSDRLYRIAALDPPTLLAVALLLAVTGLTACWSPARRAARVDPVVALRDE